MKKLIRWLADVSGVSREIKIEACKLVGKQMQDYADWFPEGETSNVLQEYPKWCLNNGWPHMTGSQFDQLREVLRNKE